jgi:hypothetical protein
MVDSRTDGGAGARCNLFGTDGTCVRTGDFLVGAGNWSGQSAADTRPELPVSSFVTACQAGRMVVSLEDDDQMRTGGKGICVTNMSKKNQQKKREGT